MDIDAAWSEWLARRTSASREALVIHHKKIAYIAALNFQKKCAGHADFDELEAAALRAVAWCVERFDPKRGVKFSTYCSMRMNGEMTDELRRMDWLSRNTRQKIKAGTIPDIQIMGAEQIKLRSKSGDEDPVGMEGIEDERAKDPAELAELSEAREVLASWLLPLEREIFRLRFVQEKNTQEIGFRLGLSQTRICQIIKRAWNRLGGEGDPPKLGKGRCRKDPKVKMEVKMTITPQDLRLAAARYSEAAEKLKAAADALELAMIGSTPPKVTEIDPGFYQNIKNERCMIVPFKPSRIDPVEKQRREKVADRVRAAVAERSGEFSTLALVAATDLEYKQVAPVLVKMKKAGELRKAGRALWARTDQFKTSAG